MFGGKTGIVNASKKILRRYAGAKSIYAVCVVVFMAFLTAVAVACSSETVVETVIVEVEREVVVDREVEVPEVQTVIVEREVIVEVPVVQTLVVEREVIVEVEREVLVVETVVIEVEKEVLVEREVQVPVVETVVVERQVVVEKQVTVEREVTVIVEKEVALHESPTVDATVMPDPTRPTGTVTPATVVATSTEVRMASTPVPATPTLVVGEQPRLAFHGTALSEGVEDYEIYAMNWDGTRLVQLTDDPNTTRNMHPSMSQDGRRIAFQSHRDGNYDIYVMNSDGSGVVQLTDNDGWDWFPSLSPDGRRIAFVSERDDNYDIYVMNSDGGGIMRLTHGGKNESPSWSPDGSRIAYHSDLDGDWGIYVMNADGSRKVQLTDHDGSGWRPKWSPDGNRIAFLSYREGRHHYENDIFLMEADGTDVMRLTDRSLDQYYVDEILGWSPDGNRIAFRASRGVYVMDADGDSVERLTYDIVSPLHVGYAP